jgi:hypothetical protein
LLNCALYDLTCVYLVEDGFENTAFYYLPLEWIVLQEKSKGCWKYKINSKRVPEKELEKMPRDLAAIIKRYRVKSGNDALAPIDFNKQLCIKWSDGTPHIISPFLWLLQLVMDLLKAIELGALRDESDTTNLLELFLPSSKDEHDNILFSESIIKQYAEGITDLLGDASVLLPTPFKMSVLPTSKSSAADRNAVKNGVEVFNSATTVPDTSQASSGATMKMAIQFVQSQVFTVMDQISEAISLKMDYDGFNSGVYKFKFSLLHMNVYNEHEVQDQLTKNANSGAVDKFEREAAMGNTPDVLIAQSFLENCVYADMWDGLRVLPSAHTQSGSGGRPMLDDDDLSDAGEISRDGDVNNPDTRGS